MHIRRYLCTDQLMLSKGLLSKMIHILFGSKFNNCLLTHFSTLFGPHSMLSIFLLFCIKVTIVILILVGKVFSNDSDILKWKTWTEFGQKTQMLSISLMQIFRNWATILNCNDILKSKISKSDKNCKCPWYS